MGQYHSSCARSFMFGQSWHDQYSYKTKAAVFLYMLMHKVHVKLTQKCMRHAMVPKYILTPNLGFLPQIIYGYALSSTLLVKVTVTWKHLVTRKGPRCIYITNMECYRYIDLLERLKLPKRPPKYRKDQILIDASANCKNFN